MPVLMKNVDPELYTKFKARAIERGLKIDEAFNEAISVWLKSSRDKSPREKTQERNELAYQLLKSTMEKEYLNKWVAIIDGQLAATADTREDLFEQLKTRKQGNDPSLVFRVENRIKRRTLGFKEIKRMSSP